MKPPTISQKVQVEPAIAKWELWTVANMLVSTRGDEAEAYAQSKPAMQPGDFANPSVL